MQSGSEFSLVGALFGWPPAPGHTAPYQNEADAWVLLFRKHHAVPHPAVLSGLFTACPAGRDWVLDAAPKLTLTLDTTAEQTPAQWQRRISALSSILSARGGRGVRLALVCNDSKASHVSALVLSTLLPGLDVAVTQLHFRDLIEVHSFHPPPSAITLLNVAVTTFGPHLTTLLLDPCPCALPPPDLLPNLRSLTLTTPILDEQGNQLEQEIARSIAPYTTQLTTLVVNTASGEHAHFPWPEMTPATPSHTLTSLSINCRVDVALLSLVTNRLPALRLLRGSRLYLGEDCSDKVWCVCELTLTQGLRAHDDILLCRLPRCQEGVKLTVRVERMELVSREEGLRERLVQRWAEWCFQCKDVRVRIDEALHHSWHTASLQHTLRQLCDGLQTAGNTNTTLCLSGWRWDTGILREYVQAMPALAERGVMSALALDGALTDATLDNIMQASPHLRSLSAPSLALQSDAHANTPWPWDELSTDTLDIADLCKLPDPAGQGAPRKMVCRELVLSERTLEVGITPITDRLKDVILTFRERSEKNGCIRLLCQTGREQRAAALEAHLSVLRAMRLSEGQRSVPVNVKAWHISMTLPKLLAGLPEWAIANHA